MKLTISLSLACFLGFAGLLHGQNDAKKSPSVEEDVNTPDTGAKVMLATYVGTFGKHKITINLDRIIGNTVALPLLPAGKAVGATFSVSLTCGAPLICISQPFNAIG